MSAADGPLTLLTVLILDSRSYFECMPACLLFVALSFYVSQQQKPTTIAATHDTTIVQRGNLVIAAVLSPPMICYGTRSPRNVSCKPSIEKPGWKEID